MSLPHARGGVSVSVVADYTDIKSSPRPWGCFLGSILLFRNWFVFPTPVGVFPTSTRMHVLSARLPHARGGVSNWTTQITAPLPSSPRPWGCFCMIRIQITPCDVFPTPVGVFLDLSARFQFCRCLPHARGGVSLVYGIHQLFMPSSPRPWGCFQSLVFETHP